jgi:membrane-bound inhibitor of C-type lysozyme
MSAHKNVRLASSTLAAALLLAPAAAAQAPEVLIVSYVCAGGAAIEVTYINPPGGLSYAVLLHDGALVPMKAGPTGSGVRYVSTGEPRLVWHTKGDAGFLARDDADMAMIASDCLAEE